MSPKWLSKLTARYDGTGRPRQWRPTQIVTMVLCHCVTAMVADAGPIRAYVSNFGDGTVSVIDAETFSVTATVPVGERPAGIVAHPDGSRVYVAARNSNTLSVIDTMTNEVTASVPMAGAPFGIDISPDGRRLYVANRSVGLVQVVDTETNSVISEIASATNFVNVHPDGSLVYTTNALDENVNVIDAATNEVIDSIGTNLAFAWSVGVHPDASRLYVTNSPIFPGRVGVIDTATNTQTSTIQVGQESTGIAVHPDGKSVYISNRADDTISVIDTETDSVTDTISVQSGYRPEGLAVHPSGQLLYVTNKNNNSVSAINLLTNEVLGTIPVGTDPITFITIVDIDPFASILGDFDANGILGIDDLAMLTDAIHSESTDLQFDVDENSLVELADRRHWVTEIKKTWIGDANLDGEFNSGDIVNVLQIDKFATVQRARWNEGDWNGDELFDRADVIVALQHGGYGRGPLAASAERAAELGGPFAAIGPDGSAGDDQTSIVYDAGTGELSLDAPAGVELTSINVDSAAGIFSGNPAQNLGGSFDNDADANIFKATFGGSFGSVSFGNVAEAGLSREFVLGDLSVVGSLAGGGDLGNVDLVYVPEPAALGLLAFGLLVVLTRRRHTPV